jgi:hypothetical protein
MNTSSNSSNSPSNILENVDTIYWSYLINSQTKNTLTFESVPICEYGIQDNQDIKNDFINGYKPMLET